MRVALDRLLKDLTLTTVALAIALGWALFQVAEGAAQLVAGLFYELDDDDPSFGGVFFPSRYTAILAWDVGGRLVALGALVVGLVELGIVLLVALLIYRRRVVSAEDA